MHHHYQKNDVFVKVVTQVDESTGKVICMTFDGFTLGFVLLSELLVPFWI